jgi:hypothetical protein
MEHGSQLKSMHANPFLVDFVSMSTASNCSITLFDRTVSKWVDVEIRDGALYVNKTGPVLELEWRPYGCRYELIFKCSNDQKLTFFVNMSCLKVPYQLGITGGTCMGCTQLIELLREKWTLNNIREGKPMHSAR